MKARRFVLDDTDKRSELWRANCLAYIKALKAPKPMEIIVRRYKRDKTAEQRGWFHSLCTLLGADVGYSMGAVKEIVKQRVFGTDTVAVGPRTYTVTPSSERDDDGEERKTDEYAKLIDEIYLLGAEAGIVLPDPDPMLARRMRRHE